MGGNLLSSDLNANNRQLRSVLTSIFNAFVVATRPSMDTLKN